MVLIGPFFLHDQFEKALPIGPDPENKTGDPRNGLFPLV